MASPNLEITHTSHPLTTDDLDLDQDEIVNMTDITAENGDGINLSSDKPFTGSSNDKLKPKRQKARRACNGCQRAHLTCSDQRPCPRCIYRGLQDACHDGVRKKPKYLYDVLSFTGSQSPQFSDGQQTSPMQAMNQASIFNFDNQSFNFGNQYGAAEFGMLHDLSTSAYDASGNPGIMNNIEQMQDPDNPTLLFGQDALDRRSSINSMPHGYTIGSSTLASTSPASPTDHHAMSESPAPVLFLDRNTNQHSSPTYKRPHSPDYIYKSRTHVYSYTTDFHRLLHYIVHRFGSAKRVRIAKALAAIQASFTRRDIVFIEVSVQRTLFQYIESMNASEALTLITQLDGVVIAASEDFMMLTGWRREALLGEEPNLNVNLGGPGGATTVSGSVSPVSTRKGSLKAGGDAYDSIKDSIDCLLTKSPHENQPMLIAELMDQDSVVDFYEDYANNPAGHACRQGKLLKFRSKEDVYKAEQQQHQQQQTDGKQEEDPHKEREARDWVWKDSSITGEKEGIVDCMYIWNVQCDNFEVPMFIIMNFLPLI